MKLVKKFNYLPISKTTEKTGARRYHTPDGKALVSVTTVLSGTKDMTFLREWKKRVGVVEADKIVKRSINYGNTLHKNLEDYIMEGKEPSGNIFARHMTNQIIKKGLVNVSEIWGCEVSLFAEGLYAGTTDLCGVHEDHEAIIDFKNARSKRKNEWVGDYKLQVVAYAMAHNSMFDTNIKRGVIMLAAQTGQYQEWIIEGKEFDKCTDEWAKRLEQYYRKNNL